MEGLFLANKTMFVSRTQDHKRSYKYDFEVLVIIGYLFLLWNDKNLCFRGDAERLHYFLIAG